MWARLVIWLVRDCMFWQVGGVVSYKSHTDFVYSSTLRIYC